MKALAVVPTRSEIPSPLLEQKLQARRAALARVPYSIYVTFSPEDRRFTVSIRPSDQWAVCRQAYFSEPELKNVLVDCMPASSADRIIQKAMTTGVCDLRSRKIPLDVARAAALGWFGNLQHVSF